MLPSSKSAFSNNRERDSVNSSDPRAGRLSAQPHPRSGGITGPGDRARVATGTRPSQSRGASPPFPGSGAAGAGRRWPGLAGPGRGRPGAEEPGPPRERSALEGPPPSRPAPAGPPPPRALPQSRPARAPRPTRPAPQLRGYQSPPNPLPQTPERRRWAGEKKKKTQPAPPTTPPRLRAQSRGRAN